MIARPPAIFLLLLLVASALSACAPLIAPLGPPIGAPALTQDAFIAADGQRLPMRTWAAHPRERAVIVAVHGFNDYSNAMTGPAAYWAAHGFTVYAYDQRGFGDAPYRGLWPGIDALTSDLTGIVRAVRERHRAMPVFVVGESMGGAVVLTAMAEAVRPAADGVILAAPAVWARSIMPFYRRWALDLSAYTVPSWTVTGRDLGIATSDNVEMLQALMRDPKVIKAARIDALWGLANLMDDALDAAAELDVPVLLLSGARDEVITEEPMNALLARLSISRIAERTVIRYDNGYHMLLRDVQAKTVWRDVARWIDSQLARSSAALPGGEGKINITDARR